MPHPARRLVYTTVASLLLGPAVLAAADKYVTSAISSVVAKEYRRKKDRDGSYRAEYYAISYGGPAAGTTSDESIDNVRFATFDELLKRHLAEQNYVLAPDAKSAELLLYVTWGLTIPFNTVNYSERLSVASNSMSALKASGAYEKMRGGFSLPSLTPEQQAAAAEAESDMLALITEERFRDRLLEENARLLGYLDTINQWVDSPARHAGGQTIYDDLRRDIEHPRYYVIVSGYDFKSLITQQKPKLLWITRISIEARGNRFDQHVATMIERAGRYFGRDSRGLVRRFEGTVELGEATVVGVSEEIPPPPATTSPETTDVGGDSTTAGTDARGEGEPTN